MLLMPRRYNIIFITCDMSAAEFERSRINNRPPSALQTSTDGTVDIIFMDKSQGDVYNFDLLVVINLKQEEVVNCEGAEILFQNDTNFLGGSRQTLWRRKESDERRIGSCGQFLLSRVNNFRLLQLR